MEVGSEVFHWNGASVAIRAELMFVSDCNYICSGNCIWSVWFVLQRMSSHAALVPCVLGHSGFVEGIRELRGSRSRDPRT